MTPDEVAVVLSRAALVDMRTIGEEEVMAWHAIVHAVDLHDALDAVVRHQGETRDRMMPADLIRHARIVRDERERREPRHEVRALPSRFEDDITRDIRIKQGLGLCAEAIGPLMAKLAERRASRRSS